MQINQFPQVAIVWTKQISSIHVLIQEHSQNPKTLYTQNFLPENGPLYYTKHTEGCQTDTL